MEDTEGLEAPARAWFDSLRHKFARNARARRLNMRLSQKHVAIGMQAAFDLRWHQTIVAKVESEERAIRLDEALGLCRIYGITLDDLLNGRNMDMIRDGYSVADEQEGRVYVESRWDGTPDAPLVPIEEHLARAEGSMKSERTKDMLDLAERLKRQFPDDEEARVRAWREARHGEHPEEG